MSLPGTMHDDEIPVDEGVARRLLATQFPRWADLPVRRVPSTGTSHALFRLGDDKSLRLPLYPGPDRQALLEAEWLPRLAPGLPLHLPVPLGLGEPTDEYPWHWSVHSWIEGDSATLDRIGDMHAAARDLGRFVRAMRSLDVPGGPPPSQSDRGCPLGPRDASVQEALKALTGEIDTRKAGAAWDRALAADPWEGPPMWLHGDLHEGNLIARGGRLCAVIDWGCLAIGDPAPDVMAAWTFLPSGARGTFRDTVAPDDATWERGRGWALSMGLIALPYYLASNPPFAALARRIVEAVLEDTTA